MILSKNEIQEAIDKGEIVIDPFDPKQLNPNSYDLRLADNVIMYHSMQVFDCANDSYENPNTYQSTEIGNLGFMLYPRHLYLMATQEYTETHNFVPMIEGRSSLARLGINVHNTAGFGDVGFKGTWTLEVSVINPIKIYAGMRVCQIYFLKTNAVATNLYTGKYNGQRNPKTSRLYTEAAEWKRG